MFTFVFVAALVVTTVGKLWLSSRQVAHVAAHRNLVPPRFAERITLAAHQKAADYTIARTRFGMIETLVGVVMLIAWTLFGGLQAASDLIGSTIGSTHPLWSALALFGAVSVIAMIVDLPFDLHRQFRLEERFGFNRMTMRLYIVDTIKKLALGVVLGVPLLMLVLTLMNAAGRTWWIDTWLVWMAFNLLLMWLFPTVIAPLFNKFEPLSDLSLKTRIEGLLARCGFASKGVFVMDGSKRSAHGNAYFTGFGAAKRIVFFDTLVSRLSGDEVEAVLAHELGHFAKRHIVKRIVWSFAMSFVALALLGWIAEQSWFYVGLGTDPTLAMRNAVALLLFFMVMPVFTFPFAPLASLSSRRHEFEADAYAAEHARPDDLIHALVKLYEDNASTLTPDPLHSTFYDSHPPAALRIGRLEALMIAMRNDSPLVPRPAA